MKKENAQKNLSGVTLLEIVIVLAVVSVMSVMTVTFSLMCGSWMNRGIAKNNVFSNINALETMLKNTFNECDNVQCSFHVEDGKLVISQKEGINVTHLYYTEFQKTHDDKGEFFINYPSVQNGTRTFITENIEKIEFSVIKNEQTGKALVVCDIEYGLPKKGEYISAETGSYRIIYAMRAAEAKVEQS